jgi:HlyD family secretion protein
MRLKAARDDLKQEEQLMAEHATTSEALEHARTQVQVTRSQLDAARVEASGTSKQGSESKLALAAADQARADLAAAEARLSWYRLQAPTAGTIIKRSVEPGDSVRPGETVIVMAAAGPLMLTVQVDEKHLALLESGLEARAVADAYPEQYFEARLSAVAPAVDADRGAVEVRLTTKNPPAFLRFDMSVSVGITTARLENVVYLPAEALLDAASARPFVFVAEGGRAMRRAVQIGAKGDEIFEIAAGVNEGDVVLVQRGIQFDQGQRVRAKIKEE